MKMKHTPGPWWVEADMRLEYDPWDKENRREYLAGWNITSSNGEIVGIEGIILGEKSEANAYLAAAAPELLEAVNEAFDFLGGVDDAADIRDKLLTVILKATGQ